MFVKFMTSTFNTILNLLFDYKRIWIVGALLVIFEVFLSTFIVHKINYTEIDWIAYVQEVEGYLNGTYDYKKLSGQTGYLPYPAAFLYVFAFFYYSTDLGTNILKAQYIFIGLYILNLILTFRIYRKTSVVPPYVLVFMCACSYRIHSIFILRLFNDPVALLIFYMAVNFFLNEYWTTGCIFFSLAVGVKMNVMLFAPGLLVILLLRHGIWKTLGHLAECFCVQVLIGIPFLSRYATSYFVRAFEFSRQFMFKWTVNWRFLPLHIFHNNWFHLSLLCGQLFFLFLIFNAFLRSRGGWGALFKFSSKRSLNANEIVFLLYVSNFIGVAFSRSLHYQFYSWYFHTLHYLFWCTSLSTPFRLLLLGVVELCWNMYPSTNVSSATLHACHLVLLLALLVEAYGRNSSGVPPKTRTYQVREPCLLTMQWFEAKPSSNNATATQSSKVTKRGLKIMNAAAATSKSL